MKKIKYFMILLITVLMTGCLEQTPKETLEDALKNMEKLESISVAAEIKISMPMMSMDMGMTGDFIKNNSSSHLKINAYGSEQELYSIEKEEGLYIYSKTDDEPWTYYVEEVKEEKTFDMQIVYDYLNNAKESNVVESEEKGFTKLKLTIEKEAFGDSLKDFDFDMGDTFGFDSPEVKLGEEMIVYVYIKDNYIHKAVAEFTFKLVERGITVEFKVDATMSLSNFNKVPVIKIPQEDLENAVYYNKTEAAYIDYYSWAILETAYGYASDYPNVGDIKICTGIVAPANCHIDATVNSYLAGAPTNGAATFVKGYAGPVIICESAKLDKKTWDLHLKGCTVGDGTKKYDYSTADDYPKLVETSVL